MDAVPSLQYLILQNKEKFGFIIISNEVIENITKYRQIGTNKNESGGILLGYRRGPHIEIVSATYPFKDDLQTPVQFSRQDKQHQDVFDKQWEESDQYIDYVGEWHTHPQITPNPSQTDKSNWTEKFKQCNKPMIGVILGMKNDWFGEISTKPIKKLTEVEL